MEKVFPTILMALDFIAAILIYGIFVATAFAYFGEIALCIRKLLHG